MSLPPLKIKSADPIKEGEDEGEAEETKDIKSEPEVIQNDDVKPEEA